MHCYVINVICIHFILFYVSLKLDERTLFTLPHTSVLHLSLRLHDLANAPPDPEHKKLLLPLAMIKCGHTWEWVFAKKEEKTIRE